MDRIAMLKQVLATEPSNTLARYGLAMEYSRTGETDAAVAEFTTLLSTNPDYVAAYQQAAQSLINAERFDEAQSLLNRGIECATRIGNPHARSEMEAMLDEIAR